MTAAEPGYRTDVEPTSRDPEARRSRAATATVVAWWAYGLIALQLVVRGFVTFPSYFFQDDFAHLDMARRSGLSADYLVRDYGGHLETGQYFLIWVVSRFVDVSFWPAALSILLLQLWASLLVFWVVRELFGAAPLVLVPLAIYLFTPLGLAWGTWWSAALQTLSLQVAMLSVLLFVARYYRTGERRWAVWSVVAHVIGLLFWEKAALILPTALAVAFLLLAPSWGWRAKLGALRDHWRWWLVHVGVLAVYVAVYVTRVGSPSDGAGSFEVDQLLGQTLMRMYVPGIFGGPWHADGAENTLYPYAGTLTAVFTCALLAALVVGSFVVRGRRALNAWVLLAGYLAMDLVLLGLGRAEWIGLLARDPRYVADALPITAIALVAAFHEPDPAARGRAYDVVRLRATTPVVVNVAALLVFSCLTTTSRLAPVAQHQYSANFTSGVLRQMSEDPDRSVVSTAAPFVVSARADVSQMMNAIGADVEFDRPATEMYVFDGLATLRRMELLAGEQVERGPEDGCGWAVGPEGVQLGSVSPRGDPVTILRVGYDIPEASVLTVEVGEDSQVLQLPSGTGRAYFVVRSQGGPLLAALSGSEGGCVTDWADGPPWVAE